MTATNSILHRNERTGAMAAIQAIQEVERMAEEYEGSSGGDNTPQESLQGDIEHRQRVVSVVLHAAGELPPHACGFVAALAEYIDFGLRIGEPNLTAWRPDAAMTAKEINQSRAETLADMLAN